MVKEAIKAGVLDKEKHDGLIRKIQYYSNQTRIPIAYICHSAKDELTYDVAKLVTNVRFDMRDGKAGYFFYNEADATHIFCLIGGAYLRNEIDARLYTAEEIVNIEMRGAEMPLPTVLLVPSFHIEGWKSDIAIAHIYKRFSMGLFSIIHVGNRQSFQKHANKSFIKFINNHFITMGL